MKTCPLGLVVSLTIACASAPVPASPPPAHELIEARIGTDAAAFVFPTEPEGDVTWDVPAPDAFTEQPEFRWHVRWTPAAPRGSVPDGLALMTYWRPGGPRHGSLAALLRQWPPLVEQECADCQESIWISQENPAVLAQVEDGHVTLLIRGANAVANIFPSVPDSVVLTRYRPGADEEEFAAAVQRNEP